MDRPVIKHNPAFLSDQELEKVFVIRQTDLELILETIEENTSGSNQHLLLIGARGMGKTMLVRRTAACVTDDKELGKLWHPIIFSEESYEVFSAAEFWLKAIYHLGLQTGDRDLQKYHDTLRNERDEKRLYEKTLGCLMDFADQQGKRLLVIAENLNMIFDDQIDKDQSWDIRHTLQNEPRIMLLGTAPTHFDEIDNTDRAMFDLFKIHPLEPLDSKEAEVLWESLAGQKVSRNKIRPLQILTGGNPRLLAIMSAFAAGATFRELMSQLTFLIDEYTNYLKSNIESLPAVERKVFATLAKIWEPSTANRIAREARLDVNKVSAFLKRLERRGAVTVVKTEKGKKSFQVTERLYNIYHLMRSSGKQADRVRAVVDFMVNFYEEESLPPDTVKKISGNYENNIHPDSLASVLGTQDNWGGASTVSEQSGKYSALTQSEPDNYIDFFTSAAAAGYTKESLQTLQNSTAAQYLEPLIIALQLDAGEDCNAPQEVLEVARDVLSRIKKKRNKDA